MKFGSSARSWAVVARALAIVALLLAVSAYDWPQFGFNSRHSADNTLETGITAANVNTLQPIPGYPVSLPGSTDNVADGAPAFLSGVATPSGIKSLLFVTTRDGTISALDWRTGNMVWSHQYGPGACTVNKLNLIPCFTTSSPAIDPDRLFVYSYGVEGQVHKYRVGDGTEIMTGGWPERATLKPWNEKGSSALSIATAANGVSYLYVANGGYPDPGDAGDYQGHVTAINLATGAQKVFNTMCSNQTVHFTMPPSSGPDCPDLQSAIWARPGVIYDPDTDKIYMATGNGTYDPTVRDWGDTVFSLNPDGSGANGKPLDSYTPTNFQDLQNCDTDVGSTGPALLPNNSQYPHLAVQGGKDGILRLINLDNMSGHQPAGPGFTGGEVFSMSVPQTGDILTMPAVWVNPADQSTWVFVANSNGFSGLRLTVDNGNPSLVSQWNIGATGSSPIVANGVLYLAGGGGITAFNPVTDAQLWNDSGIAGIHWESPIVADGILYITDESGQLTAYTPGGVVPPPLSTIFLPLVAH